LSALSAITRFGSSHQKHQKHQNQRVSRSLAILCPLCLMWPFPSSTNKCGSSEAAYPTSASSSAWP
jgi:hypothetical protein